MTLKECTPGTSVWAAYDRRGGYTDFEPRAVVGTTAEGRVSVSGGRRVSALLPCNLFPRDPARNGADKPG